MRVLRQAGEKKARDVSDNMNGTRDKEEGKENSMTVRLMCGGLTGGNQFTFMGVVARILGRVIMMLAMFGSAG